MKEPLVQEHNFAPLFSQAAMRIPPETTFHIRGPQQDSYRGAAYGPEWFYGVTMNAYVRVGKEVFKSRSLFRHDTHNLLTVNEASTILFEGSLKCAARLTKRLALDELIYPHLHVLSKIDHVPRGYNLDGSKQEVTDFAGLRAHRDQWVEYTDAIHAEIIEKEQELWRSLNKQT